LENRVLAVIFGGPLAVAVLVGHALHEHRHPNTKGHR
jgi:hypothetical protein